MPSPYILEHWDAHQRCTTPVVVPVGASSHSSPSITSWPGSLEGSVNAASGVERIRAFVCIASRSAGRSLSLSLVDSLMSTLSVTVCLADLSGRDTIVVQFAMDARDTRGHSNRDARTRGSKTHNHQTPRPRQTELARVRSGRAAQRRS